MKVMLADGPLLWAGTSHGIIRHDTRTNTHEMFTSKNSGLISNSIFFLGKLDDRLWVGTYGGGMSLFDGESWTNYNIPQGLADAFVYSAAKAPNGDVWIATWSGANRVVGGKLDDRSAWDIFTVENTQGGLPNDWVYSVQVDAEGVVWMATEGGLARYDGSSWKNWDHEAGLGAPYAKVKDELEAVFASAQPSRHHAWQKEQQGSDKIEVAFNPNYVVAMLLDSRGRVLCGTWGGGLSILEDGKLTTYTSKEGLTGNYVFALAEEPDGTIWVGTSQGLSKVPKGSFEATFLNYSSADGLLSDFVASMVFAEDQSLWVGGLGGAARFPNGLS